ncbi:unnamed protein product, partial [Rhizoctonia solani]
SARALALDHNSPMLDAPASKLFSTSSFIAVARSTTTCPDVIRWTDSLSMDFMVCVVSAISVWVYRTFSDVEVERKRSPAQPRASTFDLNRVIHRISATTYLSLMETTRLGLRMPPEILSLVLECLDYTSDISQFSLVCRSWYKHAFPHLHRHITIKSHFRLKMLVSRLDSEVDHECQIGHHLRALTIALPRRDLYLQTSIRPLFNHFGRAVSRLVRLELLEWTAGIPLKIIKVFKSFYDHCPRLRWLAIHPQRALSVYNNEHLSRVFIFKDMRMLDIKWEYIGASKVSNSSNVPNEIAETIESSPDLHELHLQLSSQKRAFNKLWKPSELFRQLKNPLTHLRQLSIGGSYEVDWESFLQDQSQYPLRRFFEHHPFLHTIEFHGQMDAVFEPNMAAHLFPSVKTFVGPIALCAGIVASPLAEQLERLNVVYVWSDPPKSYDHIFNTLARTIKPLPELQDFSVTTKMYYLYPADLSMLQTNDLNTFFSAMPNLRLVMITVPITIAEIVQPLRHVPHLAELRIRDPEWSTIEDVIDGRSHVLRMSSLTLPYGLCISATTNYYYSMETTSLGLRILPEILSLVLESLDSADMSRSSLVCRSWYKQAFPYLHRHITIKSHSRLETLFSRLDSEAGHECQIGHNLRALTIALTRRDIYRQTRPMLSRFVRAVSRLVRLELLEWTSGLLRTTTSIFKSIRDHCPRLRWLITHPKCPLSVYNNEHSHAITKLSQVFIFGDMTMLDIKWQYIKVSNSSNVPNVIIETIESSPDLHRLHLALSSKSRSGKLWKPSELFRQLNNPLVHLRQLSIGGGYEVDWETFLRDRSQHPLRRFFEHHPLLHTIEFHGHMDVVFEPNLAAQLFPSVKSFVGPIALCAGIVASPLAEQLERLNIAYIWNNPPESYNHTFTTLAGVIRPLPILQTFFVTMKTYYYCPEPPMLQANNLNTFLSAMPNVQSVLITAPVKMAEVVQPLRHVPHLTELCVRDPERSTIEDVIEYKRVARDMFDVCPMLKRMSRMRRRYQITVNRRIDRFNDTSEILLDIVAPSRW